MALEEQIVAWSQDRPDWQREVMRRVALGEVLSDGDYDSLVNDLLAGISKAALNFGLEQLPQAGPEDQAVRILSIGSPKHVNALESDKPLTFERDGLTIVFGDNGSGKSGYARLLKRITRARHREEILSDVFRETALAKPTAALTIQIGADSHEIEWPDSKLSELQRVLFYDGACGGAYINTECDFPYRPSALFVMDGLIEACLAVRRRLDERLVENGEKAQVLPVVNEQVLDTDAGILLAQISGKTSIDSVDALVHAFNQSLGTIEALKAVEDNLRALDVSKERQRLGRAKEKLGALKKHLETIEKCLSELSHDALLQKQNDLRDLEAAGDVLARGFEFEPLRGVGTAPWRALWEAARQFSEQQAYPGGAFPVSSETSRCVLCQQTLEEEGRQRISRFDRFVQDNVSVRVREARKNLEDAVTQLRDLNIKPDSIEESLADLEPYHAEVVREVRSYLERCGADRSQTTESLQSPIRPAGPKTRAAGVIGQLTVAMESVRATVEGLENPEARQAQLQGVVRQRMSLELLKEIKENRDAIVAEIARLEERDLLESVKAAAATGPITRKILELSEASITEVVRDAFTRESDRLGLERVTLAMTRGDKGALLHQPKLVNARQDVPVPRVFSEGERTALGLAAFFTEASLDKSRSALVLDDPVTSLDHTRRELVAGRLVALAESRQVLLFTHDVALVADLKREATPRGVTISERSVTRNRAAEKKPGLCSPGHPWKAKDANQRIGDLRAELARIKANSSTWDEKAYEDAVAVWAGNLSETWERIFSQEIVGAILAEGSLEIRPRMVKILALFSIDDYREFEGSYSKVSQWARRHDKSPRVNYVAPTVEALSREFSMVDAWFRRVKDYKK